MNFKNLHKWRNAILNNHLTHNTFEFKRDQKVFSILFDINSIPYKLGIVKNKTNEFIVISVAKGYQIDADKYWKVLRIMLEIPYGQNMPKPSCFFDDMDKKFPYECKRRELPKGIIAEIYKVKDSEKLYLCGFINWDRYPQSGQKRTSENLEKTRALYPEIYKVV